MKRRIYFEISELAMVSAASADQAAPLRAMFEEATREAGPGVEFESSVPVPERHAQRYYFSYDLPDCLINMLIDKTL